MPCMMHPTKIRELRAPLELEISNCGHLLSSSAEHSLNKRR